jgi:hypothetical protein
VEIAVPPTATPAPTAAERNICRRDNVDTAVADRSGIGRIPLEGGSSIPDGYRQNGG